jgi:hypothetical protein
MNNDKDKKDVNDLLDIFANYQYLDMEEIYRKAEEARKQKENKDK